jgi:hypothetical protein
VDISRSGFAEAADKFADNSRRGGIWEVWVNYDIRSQKGGGRYVVVVEPDLPPAPTLRRDIEKALEKTGERVFPGSTADMLLREAAERREARKEEGRYSKDREYWPLVKHPDLFLKFARLADEDKLDNAATEEELDTDKNAASAKEWAETYGVLGLATVEKHGARGPSTRGGKEETVAAFAREAWRANGALRLYEAATAEKLDVDLIASYMHPRWRTLLTRTPTRAWAWALEAVASETQEKIADHAFPALYGEVDEFVQGWSFKNLLGAMWLQMFWLLTATKTPRRCLDCGEIIPPEQPNQPQGSKKRGRKKGKFCNKECSDRYVYRTKTKPRRQAARGL